MNGLRERVIGFARRLAAAQKGFAAVEFALIAPVMISIYFGTTELSDSYVANAKLVSVASTAADLTAQDNQICNADMTDIMAALTPIMYPYPANTLHVVISSLVDAGNNQVKVAWSDAYNTQGRQVGSTVTIPTGLVTSGGGGSIIMAEATYDYSSPGGHLLIGLVHMSSQFYLRPRTVAQIARTATTC